MLSINITNRVAAETTVAEINNLIKTFLDTNLESWTEIASFSEKINCEVVVKMVSEKLPLATRMKIQKREPEESNSTNYLTYILSDAGDAVIVLNVLEDVMDTAETTGEENAKH